MDAEEKQKWLAALEDATDLRLINEMITIARNQENREAVLMVAVKAKAMGFRANKEKGIYELQPVQF